MSEDAVHFRELGEAVGRVRTEVVSEIRVMSDRIDRRHDALEGRVNDVEVKLAAHERTAMHPGTAIEFSRIGDTLDKLAEQLLGLGKMVAYGAGAGAVLFVVAQVVMAVAFK